MKKAFVTLCIICLTLFIFGCAVDDPTPEPTPSPEPVIEPTPELTPAPEPEPHPEPEPDPELEPESEPDVKSIYLDVFITEGKDWSGITNFDISLKEGWAEEHRAMVFDDANEEQNKYYLLFIDRGELLFSMYENGEINQVDLAANYMDFLIDNGKIHISEKQVDTFISLFQYIFLIEQELEKIGEELPTRPR